MSSALSFLYLARFSFYFQSSALIFSCFELTGCIFFRLIWLDSTFLLLKRELLSSLLITVCLNCDRVKTYLIDEQSTFFRNWKNAFQNLDHLSFQMQSPWGWKIHWLLRFPLPIFRRKRLPRDFLLRRMPYVAAFSSFLTAFIASFSFATRSVSP